MNATSKKQSVVDWAGIIASVIILAIGVALIIEPKLTSEIIAYVLGGLLCLAGIFFIIKYFVNNDLVSAMLGKRLAFGLVLLTVGIVFIILNADIARLLPKVVGAIVVIAAFFNLQLAVDLVRLKYHNWLLLLIFSLVMLVLGLIVVFLDNASYTLIGVFIGIDALLYIASTIITGIAQKKGPKVDAPVTDAPAPPVDFTA